MATDIPNMETLKRLDEAYEEATREFDGAHTRIIEAKQTEWKAATERVETYSEVIGNGFVIEEVIDPSKLRYLAGWKRVAVGGVFGPTEYDPVDLELDQEHAKTLRSLFASNVWVNPRVSTPEICAHPKMREKGIELSFRVVGQHRNIKHPKNLNSFDGYNDMSTELTEYSGLLEAIKWRLPTEEEIQQFGSVAVQAAHSS